MSNLMEFAKQELEMQDLFGKGDFYGGMVGRAVMELIEVFSRQGHSGMSASIVRSIFNTLSNFEPINPLTGTDDEWKRIGDGVFQNKRLSSVFKDAGRFNGQPYYLNAIIWQEEGGCCFSGTVEGITSSQPIKFPFLPKKFYVKLSKDREILDGEMLKRALEFYEK